MSLLIVISEFNYLPVITHVNHNVTTLNTSNITKIILPNKGQNELAQKGCSCISISGT